MYIIIVGGGKVGFYLTKDLIQKGHEVTLIERDEKNEPRLLREFGDSLFIGDGCDPQLLEEAGIKRADTLIAATGDDQDNLVVCEMGRRHFKVPRVIGRVVNPKNKALYKKMGIELTVNATEIITNLIEQAAIAQEIIPLLPLRRGDLEIVEISIPQDFPTITRTVRELELPTDCILAALIRGEHIVIPRGDTTLLPNDHLIILTSMSNADGLKKLFYIK